MDAQRLLPKLLLHPAKLAVGACLLIEPADERLLVLLELSELCVLTLQLIGLRDARHLNRALIFFQLLLHFLHLLLQLLGVGAAAIVHGLYRRVVGAFVLQLPPQRLDVRQVLAALLLELLVHVLEQMLVPRPLRLAHVLVRPGLHSLPVGLTLLKLLLADLVPAIQKQHFVLELADTQLLAISLLCHLL